MLSLRRAGGGGGAEVARVLNTMGQVYADLQRYDEALASYADALAALGAAAAGGEEAAAAAGERDEGSDPYAAAVHASVARCQQSLGRYREAEAAYLRALAVQRARCAGREELAVAQTLEELSGVCGVMGRYGEAAGRLEEALEIRRRVLEPGSLAVPQGALGLAALL